MTPYQIRKQKRRTVTSFLSAFLLHFLIIGGILIYDYFFVEDLSEFSGPILIKLGEPVGEDIPVLPEKKPVTTPVEPSSSPAAAQETPREEPQDASVPAAQPVVKSENPTLPAKPVESTTQNTASSTVKEAVPVTPSPVVPAEPQPVIVKGEEGGNSFEYQYQAEEGVISRSFGDEIFLYMPLPRTISAQLMARVTGPSYRIGMTRQDLIKQYYREVNGEFFYETEPLTGDVQAVWDYLITAGYNYKNADYKSDGYLRPVVITFTISGDPRPVLLDVKLITSSGNPEVDRAVLEGFQSATFSNSSNRNIKGRFTYRFD